MAADRRSFLKLFSAGAAIVPIIGGSADHANAARIIEPPRVEPIELAPAKLLVAEPINARGSSAGVVTIEFNDGYMVRFPCRDIRAETRCRVIDVTALTVVDAYTRVLTGIPAEFNISGTLID